MRGIPIGNFFSKQELFYLTHIHENRADIGKSERRWFDRAEFNITAGITLYKDSL